MRALLELLQLVYPQVVETTGFNPEDVLPHLLESRSTHLPNYLCEVSHIPKRLSLLLELPLLHVVGHVVKHLENDVSLPLIGEVGHLIVEKPIH